MSAARISCRRDVRSWEHQLWMALSCCAGSDALAGTFSNVCEVLAFPSSPWIPSRTRPIRDWPGCGSSVVIAGTRTSCAKRDRGSARCDHCHQRRFGQYLQRSHGPPHGAEGAHCAADVQPKPRRPPWEGGAECHCAQRLGTCRSPLGVDGYHGRVDCGLCRW